ncbi:MULTISPECIES: hypothetical protein [unclassified Roseateles]|uniref:hypothetical protein n=1 Tax=Pelomonas sp. Root1237 TaxID=1736434 RepID=UPI0006FF476A|nr:hypothetical protein [Pelomonas sp. Root1237]KQV94794.1 hypothetical protein ASC91_26310 [Pelomonas sp. Root1237]
MTKAIQPNEEAAAIAQEFIDFVNAQCGAYMDALAGYAGHHTKVERQVHRILRPTKTGFNEAAQKVVVWTSYEDPSQPDVILDRITRANDYMAANAPGGSNEQQHARSIVIFIYAYWELEIRQRLADSMQVKLNMVQSDVMGDLRILRNAILHKKAFLHADDFGKLTVTQDLFPSEQRLHIGYEDLQQIFVRVKRDCARIILECLGAMESAPFDVSQLTGVALQRSRKPGS